MSKISLQINDKHSVACFQSNDVAYTWHACGQTLVAFRQTADPPDDGTVQVFILG